MPTAHLLAPTRRAIRALAGAACLVLPAPALAQAPAWASALDSLVASEMARTRTPGAQVAVVVSGVTVYSRGYGVADIETGRAVTARTLFRVGSVTKMVTSATLLQLAAAGKLDLQKPISTYVPELAGRKVGTVTTHQLLTHTAGWLDNAIPYGRMGEAALGEVMREVGDSLFFTEPSRVISYSNPGYSMAGYIAERAGDGRFGTLAEQQVLRRLGMPRATFRPLAAMTEDFSQGHVGQPGNPGAIVRPFTENTAQWSAGFLFASAEEMARFTIAMMDGGRFEGQQILDSSTVRQMTTGHVAVPGSATARYGYGLMVDRRGESRIWQHGGSINGFDAQVTMFPDQKLAVIVLDNRGGEPMRGIIDFVAKQAAGLTPPAPPADPVERAGTAEERAKVVGRYGQGRTNVEVVEEAGGLVFVQGGRAPAKLAGDDRLVITPPQGAKVTILLVRGADGRVEYLHQGLRALARKP